MVNSQWGKISLWLAILHSPFTIRSSGAVYNEVPVRVEYTVTEYVNTLENVILELHKWGVNHRKKVIKK